MNTFRLKLLHNFHELSHLEKIFYWIFIRPSWEKEKRFFFEGSLLLPGQMYIEDRKALFNLILDRKPNTCFEIGTYTGGGSTFFIAQAFYKIKKGKLFTLEIDFRLFNKARNYYAKHLPHLAPHVEFVHGESFDVLKPYMINMKIDSFFLDGAEDPDQTLNQYNSFLLFCRKGSILIAHDWNTDKSILVRPIIENDKQWSKICEVIPPLSVGFAAFERL